MSYIVRVKKTWLVMIKKNYRWRKYFFFFFYYKDDGILNRCWKMCLNLFIGDFAILHLDTRILTLAQKTYCRRVGTVVLIPGENARLGLRKDSFNTILSGEKCESYGIKRGDSWDRVGFFLGWFKGWKHMGNTWEVRLRQTLSWLIERVVSLSSRVGSIGPKTILCCSSSFILFYLVFLFNCDFPLHCY